VLVATAADFGLLKLYASGTQDAWDVEQLLAGPGRAAPIGPYAWPLTRDSTAGSGALALARCPDSGRAPADLR